MFKPKKHFFRITDISADFLREMGIKGLALDADNTLSEHHSQTPLEGVEDWLRLMEKEGFRIVMVSNSKSPRIIPFAGKLKLDYISLAMKPLPFGFIRASRRMGIKLSQLGAIGDQLFTDMLGANLCGAKGILVTPIKEEMGKSFVIRRRLEKKLLKKYGDSI